MVEKRIIRTFRKLGDFTTDISFHMCTEARNVKDLAEEGEKGLREVQLKRSVEFGIHDCSESNKTIIRFSFGSIRLSTKAFNEAVRRYSERNEFIKRLVKSGKHVFD